MPEPSLALVGAGNWGKNFARIFFQRGVLHTICDLNEALLQKYRSFDPNVRVTNDFHALLKNPAIHQLVIATPISTHYTLAKEALLAGKDVLVEKPLCMNVDEAEELIQIAKSEERVLMVGHLLQYHPVVLRIQAILQTGQLGALQSIVAKRMNAVHQYQEGDVLWDLAPHDLSLILSFVPNPVAQSFVCKHVDYNRHGSKDHVRLNFQLNSAVHVDVSVSKLNPLKEQSLTLQCEQASLIFDDIQPWDKKLAISNRGHSKYFPIEPDEPLLQECIHFLNCCASRQVPKTDGEEAKRVVQTLAMAETITLSYKSLQGV